MKQQFRTAVFSGMIVLGLTATAFAQASRTWVSGVGDDANPCNRTAPCKTFAGAISKTATGGVINALDPGGFGAVTITKSISILGGGFEAGVLVSGTNGIIINAPASNVILSGLEFEGLGTGLNAITILQADSVLIADSIISDFRGSPGNAVRVASSTEVDVRIDHVTMAHNLGGVEVAKPAALNRVFITNSLITDNVNFSVKADGGRARVQISNSAAIGANTDLRALHSGQIVSYQNNVIGSGSPTGVLLLK